MSRKVYILQINSDIVSCLSNATVAHKTLVKAAKVYDNLKVPAYRTVYRELEEKNIYELFYQHPGTTQAVRFKITLFLLRSKVGTAKQQKEFSFVKSLRIQHRVKQIL